MIRTWKFTIHKMHTHKVGVLDFQECLFVLTEYFLFHLLQGLHLTVFVFQFVCLSIYAHTAHTRTVWFSWFVCLCWMFMPCGIYHVNLCRKKLCKCSTSDWMRWEWKCCVYVSSFWFRRNVFIAMPKTHWSLFLSRHTKIGNLFNGFILW